MELVAKAVLVILIVVVKRVPAAALSRVRGWTLVLFPSDQQARHSALTTMPLSGGTIYLRLYFCRYI